MKTYRLFDRDSMEWENIYCKNALTEDGSLDMEKIAKSIMGEVFIGKFVKEDYTITSENVIHNDDRLFLTKGIYDLTDDVLNIWQIGSKASDRSGVIVPDLYEIRAVGIVIMNVPERESE